MDSSISLLVDYNSRLAVEMEDRKRLTQMMREFLQAQRDLMAQAEATLEVGSSHNTYSSIQKLTFSG